MPASVLLLAGALAGVGSACGAPDGTTGHDVDQARQALNGQVVHPDDSCSSIGPLFKDVAVLARTVVADNRSAFTACLADAYLSATDHDAERIANLMATDVPTQITCQPADEIKALARAPYSFPDEIVIFNRDAHQSATAAGTLGVFLHEVAHTKRYAHHDTDRDLAAMGTWEYGNTVPSAVSICGSDASQPTELPSIGKRRSLPDETTLGPIGDGSAGYPYPPLHCRDGEVVSGLSGSGSDAVEKLQLSCRKPGSSEAQLTAAVGWRSPSSPVQSVECGPGNVMVGVTAYTESHIHGLYPICAAEADVRAGSPSFSHPGGLTGWNGLEWTDPNLYRSSVRHCPPKMAITGVRPRLRRHLERLEFICQTLDAARAPVETALAQAGVTVPSDTNTYYEERCPGRTAVFSIDGNTSDRVHRIGALCRAVDCNTDCAKPYLTAHGGWAGLARKDMCTLDERVVGLTVRSSDDGVEGYAQVCAPKDSWARGDASGRRTLTWRGGTTKPSKDLICPPGQFLEGWRIAGGNDIQSIQPLCRRLEGPKAELE